MNFYSLVWSIGENDMSRLRGDGGKCICGDETCHVSDFYISEMIFTSLPSEGDSLDGNYLSPDCRYSEPTRFGASDQHLVQAALENDTKVSNTCIVPHEEATGVQENASFYSACQIKSCSEDTDFKSDLDKTDCFNPQLFIKSLPELSDVESIDLSAQIPKQSQQRKSVTLVLDLDGKKLSIFQLIIN